MASACVNDMGVPPEGFIDCSPPTFPAYGWLGPRISFGRDYNDVDNDDHIFSTSAAAAPKPSTNSPKKPSDSAVSGKDGPGDFEFRLDDPVAMHPADELFSDGKLVPLQISATLPAAVSVTSISTPATTNSEARAGVVGSPEEVMKTRRTSKVLDMSADPYLFSPKAPRCTSRWRELLGLSRLGGAKQERCGDVKTASSISSNVAATAASCSPSASSSSHSNTGKSICNFLNRTSKSLSNSSASNPTLSLPLLRDSDCESVSISSRLSLSSSSSGPDHDDLPRLSLDTAATDNKSSQIHHLNHIHISLSRSSSGPIHQHGLNSHPRVIRMAKPRLVPTATASLSAENQKPLIDYPSAPTAATTNRVGRSPIRHSMLPETAAMTKGVSVDSPRMNSSGKIVFQGLERSSSSPSSFNGGPRYKHQGMERSYSANVRVTPVLNVPVCSLRGSSKSGGGVFGFGQFFSSSPQSSSLKKEVNGGGGSSKSQHPNRHRHRHHLGSGRSKRGGST